MVDAKGDIIMCKIKMWMDKGGQYDVHMIVDANIRAL